MQSNDMQQGTTCGRSDADKLKRAIGIGQSDCVGLSFMFLFLLSFYNI